MTEPRADSIRVMCPLFHAGEGGSTPTSALQLRFDTTDVHTAVALNRLWHSRLPRLVASNVTRCPRNVCYVGHHGGLFYATAVWTDPVARALNGQGMLELRRFAIGPDAPRYTASRMLAWMARDLADRFGDVRRLISYQDCDSHTGCIYRAAGWRGVPVGGGGQWASTRSRVARRIVRKIRWEKVIR